MVSVMNKDFDMGRNPSSAAVAADPGVSNDDNVAVESREGLVSDLNVKEETRVATGDDSGAQRSEMDGTRVSPGPGQEGDCARVLDLKSNHQLNGDSGYLGGEGVSSGNDGVHGDGEIGRGVHDEKSTDAPNEAGVIDGSEERTRGLDTLSSPSASDSDATGDGAMRQKGVHNHEGLAVDAANGDLRLERHSNLQASVNDDVATAGPLKVLGSQFEMGDMVWGKVKSHPWWPGHVYNEAFASSSVRRSRRDGHVLVAFFGDSSYGWFDRTELIPYEPHYAEKSQQTNSRNFLNAVEESVDEASRRSALGLSCRCRNPNNFRPANVPGCKVVDVVDYEPGAIYSVSQIQKARESFQPAAMLSFIKQLAAAPSGETKSLDFIRHRAAALAYRRSLFEEFDETYAQAFGQQPVRPSPSAASLTDKEPSRAPLSGPLVFAEALGGRKGSNKATKSREVSKKDKYLFKRRDEAGDLRTTPVSQGPRSLSSSSASEHGTSDSAAASYVFQKRDQVVPINDEHSGAPAMDPLTVSAHAATMKDIPGAGLDVTTGPAVSVKRVSPGPASVPQQSESSVAMTTLGSDMHSQVPESRIGTVSSTEGGLMKKKKAAKRPAGEQNSEKPDIPEKKMKKLRKTDAEKTTVHMETRPSGSGGLFKQSGKPMQITASSRDRKDIEASESVPQQLELLPPAAVEGNEEELPQLLADLLGLALNPFHGVERNRPAIVRQFFLKFRSLVFLKSSGASPPAESELTEARAIRSPPGGEPADRSLTESCKIVRSLKQSKLSGRHDDPTKGGRKRVPSERQEEIAAKRAKKITEVKSLAAEKKALLKNPEIQHIDGKAKVAAVQQSPSRVTKTEQHLKKAHRPPRVEEPTYLVMKFQSGSSLPSLMELKARFARFGPLDTSLSRVFYKTNTCRVAFLYKQDAHVAYRYAVGSKSVFSNVKFMLKPVSEPQQPSSVKAEDLHSEPVSNRDSSTTDPRLPVPATPVLPPLPIQQLKSCLKKPSGSDELGGPNNGSGTVKTTRVRFNMGEDKGGASNRPGGQVQMTDSRNANLSSESGLSSSSSSSSSSIAMDTVSNNQRFITLHPLQPPLLPTPPPQFLRLPPPINHPHQHHVELPPRTNVNYNVTTPPIQAPPSPGIDISQQMMSLLTRCHEVVTNVKSILGYVPYHPL